MTLLEREKLNFIKVFIGLTCQCDKLQVADALTDGDSDLVSVYDSRKELAAPLPSCGFDQEIVVLCERNEAEVRRPIQDVRIVLLPRAVLL